MFDLHIHSTYSDGTDDVETIINNIAKTNIKYFSITDHDVAESAREIFASKKLQKLIKDNGLTYVPGIEMTCKFNNYKMHILGYDYDPDLPEIKHFEKEVNLLLKEKDVYRQEKLKEMGYIFSEKSMQFLNTRKNIRQLDVAKCLVDDGYFSDNQDAITLALKKIHYPKSYKLDGGEVVKTLAEKGVKMVWAHSLHGIGEKPITFEEVESVLVELKKLGLSGLECYYSLYNADEINRLIEIAKKLDLFITIGSDYHGTNKYVKLGEVSCDGTIPQDGEIKVESIFSNIIK